MGAKLKEWLDLAGAHEKCTHTFLHCHVCRGSCVWRPQRSSLWSASNWHESRKSSTKTLLLLNVQGLVRVEATEVEFEECLELAGEQERQRLEAIIAEQEQRKHEQRLAELSRVRAYLFYNVFSLSNFPIFV